ncbi:MAG TPA: trigger factor [Candidatus Paceibacterota bacterium]|nr:trigger factor [Candidatus Paceibacterota bacterium]
MNQNFKILKIAPLPHSQVEIEAEIPEEVVESYRKEAVKNLNSRLKIDGFREGHIPEKVLIERVGELGLLEESASLALENLYLKILTEAKVNPVGRPQIAIPTLAAKNPVVFKITLAVLPEFSLPDYKKIAKEAMKTAEKAEVTDQEFEETLTRARESRRKTETDPTPELTDELVKSFGDFKNVEDFKTKLRENLQLEKELRLREKERLTLLDKIIDKTKVEIPEVLIESEKEKMLAQFKGNISGMGLKPEDYFKQIGKTEADVKDEWKDDAIKRVKMELILAKIALEEKIEADKKAVEQEMEHILSHHKDADPMRARLYVEQILTNEKVWQFLESQK